VVEKFNYCNIQQKILQNSNFAKKRDLNTVPNGEVAEDIAKMFAKKILKIIFLR
jgi:beta-galactosidase beta subunit